MFKKILSLAVIVCFFLTTLGPYHLAHADSVLGLPAPGTMINLSPAYEPVIIKGLTVHKDNPFLFDFIIDVGQDKMSGEPLKKEGEKLIKYFLASLAVPDKDRWVNLSPYEKNKMIPEALGQTDMGRDLLEQDYILKQITSSLIYPEKKLGRIFWDNVYTKAQEMYGTTQIPVNTFNKVWIMADRAEVFEHNQTTFVVAQHLKVMLEEDYLALQKHSGRAASTSGASEAKQSYSIASQIIREVVLPELEREVNTGKNFGNLRQIFNSVILSTWYRRNLKEALLNQVYANKSKVQGINLNDPTVKQQIYEQYLKAYKKGVFNYIKEDMAAAGTMIPRKYFSGGIPATVSNLEVIDDPVTGDAAMRGQDWHGEMDFATVASTQPDAAMRNSTKPKPLINFKILTLEVFEKRVETAKRALEKRINKIINIPAEQRTFENTIAALDIAKAQLYKAVYWQILPFVSPDGEMRQKAQIIRQETNQLLLVELNTRNDLYHAIEEYLARGEKLNEEDQRLLETTLEEFRKNGMGMLKKDGRAVSDAERQRVLEIKKRLQALIGQFQTNLVQYKLNIKVAKDDLEGLLSAAEIESFRTKEGEYVITTLAPLQYENLMQFSENPVLRGKLEYEFNRRTPQNIPLLEEALKLRQELAKILGYDNYADYVIRNRMAKNPQEVVDFLNNLKTQLVPLAQAEDARLLEIKLRYEPQATRIENGERAYYQNLRKKEQFDYNPQEVSQYFPLDRTVQNIINIYEQILGVTVTEIKKPLAWDESVRLFAISDETGKPIGQFYLDLRPREGKFPRFALFNMRQAYQHSDGSYEPTVEAMVGNFAADNLSYKEVAILFHEFGHLMHMALTKAKYPSLSGIQVPFDSLEIPSQMFENLAWQPEIIKRISGGDIPDALIEKMIGARSVGLASLWLASVGLSLVDLNYHTQGVSDTHNSINIFLETMHELGIKPTSDTHFPSAFAHIMGSGYDSGFYSYPWSLVYAQDAWGRFEREGIFNPQVGRDFRALILEPGASKDPTEQLRKFLGREPNSDAFLNFLGIQDRAMTGKQRDAAMMEKGADTIVKNLEDLNPGGIDLNTTNGMQWKDNRVGNGVEINIDQAMIARFRRQGIEYLKPVILKVTPIKSVWSLVNM